MKALIHSTSFPSLTKDIADHQKVITETGALPEGDVDLDVKMWHVLYLLENNRQSEAGLLIDTLNYEPSINTPAIYTAWLWLTRMSIYISHSDYVMAIDAAVNSLHAVERVQVKKGEDFLALIAGMLYNLAAVHHATGENSRATKELSKSQKLYERLAKKNEARFATMLTYAVEASTLIFKSKQKQMAVFAHYHDLTEQYSGMVEGGNVEAVSHLVDSLHKEGDIMLEMGNYRDAMKYFTKALRYQKRISGEMGYKELIMSIGLAHSLMHIAKHRESAEQLLTSLMPLARRLGDVEAQNSIMSLLDKKSKNRTIMSLLKSIF